jgi:hypothetical protein
LQQGQPAPQGLPAAPGGGQLTLQEVIQRLEQLEKRQNEITRLRQERFREQQERWQQEQPQQQGARRLATFYADPQDDPWDQEDKQLDTVRLQLQQMRQQLEAAQMQQQLQADQQQGATTPLLQAQLLQAQQQQQLRRQQLQQQQQQLLQGQRLQPDHLGVPANPICKPLMWYDQCVLCLCGPNSSAQVSFHG